MLLRFSLLVAMLQQFALRGRTISAITFDCGLSDLPYFNCAFRRRFGARPSDLREAGQLEHDPEKWEPVFGKDHAQTKG